MVDLSGIDHKSIVERAKAIILTPKDEWPKIANETKSQGDILKGYVLPLIVIGPLASFVGDQLFGRGLFSSHPPLIASLIGSLVKFALLTAGVFILSIIFDFLAPKFNGQANRLNAFKLAAYGVTAACLAQIFALIPQLGFFTVLGLYSIYLIYVGSTPLMKVPEDKAGGYVAVTLLCSLVGGVILWSILAPITLTVSGLLAGGAMSVTGGSESGGKLTLPGGGTIDTGNVEKLGKQFEDIANGKAPPVELAKLQALLPTSIGAYQRTVVESAGIGAIGGQAEGTYTAGDNNFRLKIVDMPVPGALVGMGSALGVQQNREDADSYERTGTVNGQMQSESWNKSSGQGKFGVVVANRFMIEAEGKAASIDELKEAVAKIDQGNLLSLAG